MYGRVMSHSRGIFVICLIFFIVFETYLIKNPGFDSNSKIKNIRFTQKNEEQPALNNSDTFNSIIEPQTDVQPTNQSKDNGLLNEDLFGPLNNDSVIIIVQVHNRIIYLKQLIKSLSQVKNISEALLIFSHDYHDEDINKLVQTIQFCKVLQIFFPYSIQNHENEFPGHDPNDCPPDISRMEAILRNCVNALHPDHNGHYRVAETSQTKHHWWWKANHVFDQLDITRYYTGLVLFLEEDHYVAEDFLYLLKLMQKQAPQLCPICRAFALGTHLDLDFFEFSKTDEVDVCPWEHNMGFAINRSTWNEIVKCAKQFCTYDDYNWDFTFRYVSQQCLPNVIATMALKRPRVFHIGECGTHIKKDNCDPSSIVSRIDQFQKNAFGAHKMYPKQLKLSWQSLYVRTFVANGGWGDVRDHELCMSFTRNETLKLT